MRTDLACDLETFSSVDLLEAGVFRYTEAPDFQILIIGYKFNDQDSVTVFDATTGEDWPEEFVKALTNKGIRKHAYNAQFERTCLAKATGKEMPPEQWRDTMILALELGLPRGLAAVGMALGLPEEQMKDPKGKALIQYFSKPCKPTKANGGRSRNMPEDDPEKWQEYLEYNRQDVVTEEVIREKLMRFGGMIRSEQELWELDQRLNDNGVRIDVPMVEKIVAYDKKRREELLEEAKRLTGSENPNSLTQLKAWLSSQGVNVSTLTKDSVEELLKSGKLPAKAKRVLNIRQALGKTSTAKYSTMLGAVSADGRLRGILQFYGANRSGRWSGKLVQTHNLARNSLPDLDDARELAAEGRFDEIQTLYGETAFVFSELVRTAFIPSEGCRFVVSDFSAIEARVISWLAGEEWRLEAFRQGKDIYCESASRMYHVPVVKHGENGELRQKGKIAELALGYQGGVGALKAMDRSGSVPEDEMQDIIDTWRAANPKVVKMWKTFENAAKTAIGEHRSVKTQNGIIFRYIEGNLFVQLPNRRQLCYWGAKVKDDPRGYGQKIVYKGVNQTTKQWEDVETYGGKLVENCIAKGTPVLTKRGPIPIEEIRLADQVWDGKNWVEHEGLIERGEQETIEVDGIRMTPDHKILTEGGWQSASSSKGFNRYAVKLPDGYSLCGIGREKISMESQMRLRQGDHNAGVGVPEGEDQILRLHEEEADRKCNSNASPVEASAVCGVAINEGSVLYSDASSMEELRRQRDKSLQQMDGELRELPGRYASNLQTGTDSRPDQCQRRLYSGELPLGDIQGASQKQAEKPLHDDGARDDDSRRDSRTIRNRSDDADLPNGSWVPGKYVVKEAGCKKPVYDLKNAGTEHRFTVLSNVGPMLVHNCVQATARDCLAEVMRRVTALGYSIVMHVHDEIIVDVPLEDKTAPEKITAIMGEPIVWAIGLPLKGETYETMFYKKD